MFSGWGLKGVDGTAWYHPLRLTIDAGAVGNGIANPAQDVLDVHATHGTDLPRDAADLRVRCRARRRSRPAPPRSARRAVGNPRVNLTLADRATTYAHNDPNSAAPDVNDFLKKLMPFLRGIRHASARRLAGSVI